jgi:hypothetical protein
MGWRPLLTRAFALLAAVVLALAASACSGSGVDKSRRERAILEKPKALVEAVKVAWEELNLQPRWRG